MKQLTLIFLLLVIFLTTPFFEAQSRTRFYYYPSYRVINWRMPFIMMRTDAINRVSTNSWPPKYPPVAAYDQRLIDYATYVGETQRLAWLAQQKAKNKAAQNTSLPSFRIETQKNQNNN